MALPARTQNLQSALDEITEEIRDVADRGKVADYIPELAKIDNQRFGISIATVNGAMFSSGDAQMPFSIQSISKVFTLALALGKLGSALWKRVGLEPSGSAFNSIVQLEYEKGIPRNPFINSGAIVVTDTILGVHRPAEAIAQILNFVRSLSDDDSIAIDPAVAKSEMQTGYRNIALANYIRGFKNLDHEADQTLGVYFHQCAIAMSCQQLAAAALFLANDGVNPLNGESVISGQRARRICALMMTCGHYDGSGDFAFRVGLPGKSGVAGGILTIVPGVGSIVVWSPGLNANGNSLLGTHALELLTQRTGWNVFGV
ncbi:MAG: glutaminase [Burkholderiaceae bacterium]